MKRLLMFLLISAVSQQIFAQTRELSSEGRVHRNKDEARRLALVIGNLDYELDRYRNISNTVRDADSIAIALKYIGFDVTKVINVTEKEFKKAVDQFVGSLRTNDVAFFYYSGHGAAADRTNYLIPVNYTSNCVSDLKYDCISLEEIVNKLQERGARNTIAVVDACRDLSLNFCGDDIRSGGVSNNLVKPENNPEGTLIAFATDYGSVSNDRSYLGKNGLYTEALLKYIRMPYNLSTIFDSTGITTLETSRKLNLKYQQRPVFESKILGINSFFFLKPTDTPIDFDFSKKDSEIKELRLQLANQFDTKLIEAEKLFEDKDYFNAQPKYTYLAEHRNSIAQLKLAYLYLNGLGVKQNIKEAHKWYTEANKNGSGGEVLKFINNSKICNQLLLREKKAFTQKKFLNVGGIALGAGALFLSGTAMYNSVQREADSFNESIKVWDANGDGFWDGDFEDDYNAAADSYNQKRKLFPVSIILRIVGGGAAAVGIPIVLSKKFKGIDYNFGVGHNGQPLIFKLTKPL